MDRHDAPPTDPPKPRVRSAKVFRTLVMTALAALPSAAGCTGRNPVSTPPAETSAADAGGADADEPADAGSPATDPERGDVYRGGPTGESDGGSTDEPAGDGGRVFRGGASGEPDSAADPGDAGESESGRVFRGAPGEDAGRSHEETAEPDAGRRDAGRRDAGPPPVTDYGVPMPLYGVPEPEYAVPAYGVYPVPPSPPSPPTVTEYAVPMPPDLQPVSAYAAPLPDDDPGPVMRYMAPFPRDD